MPPPNILQIRNTNSVTCVFSDACSTAVFRVRNGGDGGMDDGSQAAGSAARPGQEQLEGSVYDSFSSMSSLTARNCMSLAALLKKKLGESLAVVNRAATRGRKTGRGDDLWALAGWLIALWIPFRLQKRGGLPHW